MDYDAARLKALEMAYQMALQARTTKTDYRWVDGPWRPGNSHPDREKSSETTSTNLPNTGWMLTAAQDIYRYLISAEEEAMTILKAIS